MNNTARTYGLSLYSLAKDENKDEVIYGDMRIISDSFDLNPEYINILDSAAVSVSEKDALIDTAFSEYVHIYCVNLLKILAHKRLACIFAQCTSEYEKRYREDRGIETVKIITAADPSVEKRNEILQKLSKIYNKQLVPTFITDPTVLGGIIVKFENSSIDGSVKARLDKLKKVISE